MHLHKRAQTTGYILTWMIFTTLMLIIIFGSLIVFTDRALNPKRDTFSLQASLLSQRLLSSPNSLSYVDPVTGRAYPGIIDAAKLRDPDLEQALAETVWYDEPAIGAKLIIGTRTVYYNKAYYDRYQPLVGRSGPGGARSEAFQRVMLIRDKGVDTPTLAIVQVVQVNP